MDDEVAQVIALRDRRRVVESPDIARDAAGRGSLGENPRIPLDVMAAARRPGGDVVAVSLATKMNDTPHQLPDSLKMAQLTMTEGANKKRRPHEFLPGDSVYVNTRCSPRICECRGRR